MQRLGPTGPGAAEDGQLGLESVEAEARAGRWRREGARFFRDELEQGSQRRAGAGRIQARRSGSGQPSSRRSREGRRRREEPARGGGWGRPELAAWSSRRRRELGRRRGASAGKRESRGRHCIRGQRRVGGGSLTRYGQDDGGAGARPLWHSAEHYGDREDAVF